MAGFERDLFGDEVPLAAHGSTLSDTWDYPPFSVLSARDGWWQERKRQWLGLGIESEIGRDAAKYKGQEGLNNIQRLAPGGGGAWLGGPASASTHKWAGANKMSATIQRMDPGACKGGASGTSIFDPVLTELCYRWFCPRGGKVIDPFAGGSVRGIVASALGFSYAGCELRPEQVAANREQLWMCSGPEPVWHEADARDIRRHISGPADMVFSCPPYVDLEVYSDDPRDLSTMSYPEFIAAYNEIISASCALLMEDSFAVFVVGEVRDRRGNYYNFVGDTVRAFQAAGLHYYNEAIMVTAVGSLPIRAGKQFAAGRKLGKTHQNVLVFVKGDGKAAAKRAS